MTDSLSKGVSLPRALPGAGAQLPEEGGAGQAQRSPGHGLRASVGDSRRSGRVVVPAFELDGHLGQPVTAEG